MKEKEEPAPAESREFIRGRIAEWERLAQIAVAHPGTVERLMQTYTGLKGLDAGKAEPTPAADPEGEWWLRGEQRRDLDAAEAGVKLQQKADESGATREKHPACCVGRVCVIAGYPENCSCNCHRKPGIEPGRGESTRAEEVGDTPGDENLRYWANSNDITSTQLAFALYDLRVLRGLNRAMAGESRQLEDLLHAAEERLVEQIQENQRLEKGTVALEEARRLAEQDRQTVCTKCGYCATSMPVRPVNEQVMGLLADRERLQGELNDTRNQLAKMYEARDNGDWTHGQTETIKQAEFDRLYQKIVNRISADIAGDFDAALDQLEYNIRERSAQLVDWYFTIYFSKSPGSESVDELMQYIRGDLQP